MKTNEQTKDLSGTVTADISDLRTQHNSLEDLAKHFKIDLERFSPIGIEVFGTKDFTVSFKCIDKNKSSNVKEHIVMININEDYKEILGLIFKRLHFSLYSIGNEKYCEIDCAEEIKLSDYKSS